jgi:hypothetical protein
MITGKGTIFITGIRKITKKPHQNRSLLDFNRSATVIASDKRRGIQYSISRKEGAFRAIYRADNSVGQNINIKYCRNKSPAANKLSNGPPVWYECKADLAPAALMEKKVMISAEAIKGILS